MKESGAINLQTLAGQANKALFSLKSALQNLNYPNPKIMCQLFDSLYALSWSTDVKCGGSAK